jgi:dTMP kinase
MAPGRFITFEGGEGSGKSTQASLLAARLEREGIAAILTREPGGSPFAEQVREFLLRRELAPHAPLAEALLFYAARCDHLAATIRPALAAGRWVVCDRYSDSTRVYQGIAGEVGSDAIAALERLIVEPTRPDLTFVLDLAPEIGLSRLHARQSGEARRAVSDDPYERRELSFHERLRAGFRAIARAEPDRCVLVDAAAAPERIAHEVWTMVSRRLLARPA